MDETEAARRRDVLFATVASYEGLLRDALAKTTTLEEELERVRHLNSQTKDELSARNQEVENLTRTIDEIRGSTSWRITTPLREVSQRLRRHRTG